MVVCSVEAFIETSEGGLIDRSWKKSLLNVRKHSTITNEHIMAYHYTHYQFDEHVIIVPWMRPVSACDDDIAPSHPNVCFT